MEKLISFVGPSYELVIYKKPSIRNGRRIVAEAIGEKTAYLSEEFFKEHEEEIKRHASQIHYGKAEYERKRYYQKLRNRKRDLVRCVACGRLVKKEDAIYVGLRIWHCGC